MGLMLAQKMDGASSERPHHANKEKGAEMIDTDGLCDRCLQYEGKDRR